MNLTSILHKVLDAPLSEADAREAALALMTGEAPPAQVGALLSALRVRGESGPEILGFAQALREKAGRFPLPEAGLIDTCGTGGDGLSTFNVSTLAGLVAAGAGARVAKHGNRAVSSRCGSADLLEALGVKIDSSPAVTARCVSEASFGFLFAPHYHQTLKHVGPVRRELGFRSIFNLVGPLANPAGVKRQVVGVPLARYLRPVAEALRALGVDHALVVHGSDGSDEITLIGPTSAVEVRPTGLRDLTFHPEDAGLAVGAASDLVGGDAATNAAIAHRLLDGERGARHDFVVLNAAAALMVAGRAASMREGAEMARESLLSGRARTVLEQARTVSQEGV